MRGATILTMADRPIFTIDHSPEALAEVKAFLAEHDRDSILTRLGYADYDTYLRGYLWAEIRQRILRRYDGFCVRCDSRATEVHHIAYTESVLLGQDDTKLRPMCRGCHDVVGRDPEEAVKVESLDENRAMQNREERFRLQAGRAAADDEYARQTGYRCESCTGDARGYNSIEMFLSVRRGENDERRLLLCVGCYKRLTADGRGRRLSSDEQMILLQRPAPRHYTRPEVGEHGHANCPQNWARLSVRQREAWTNEYLWLRAQRLAPTLRQTDPDQFAGLKAAFEATCMYGRTKRISKPRPLRGPDLLPAFHK
jgi:hypothetical protein